MCSLFIFYFLYKFTVEFSQFRVTNTNITRTQLWTFMILNNITSWTILFEFRQHKKTLFISFSLHSQRLHSLRMVSFPVIRPNCSGLRTLFALTHLPIRNCMPNGFPTYNVSNVCVYSGSFKVLFLFHCQRFGFTSCFTKLNSFFI